MQRRYFIRHTALTVSRTLHCDADNGGTILNDKEAQAIWGREYQKGRKPDIQLS